MRKVIVQEFVSVDGLASGPNGSVDFIPASSEGDQRFGRRQVDFMDTVDAILLGTVTYKMFAGYWPNVAADADDKEFADKINALPKIVFSSTLERAPWGRFQQAQIVKGPAEDAVARMKAEAGKDMVIWGSIGLAQSLMAAGVVDEVQLIVCPVVLTEGRRLFESPLDSLALELDSSQTFDRGNVLLSYATAPIGPPSTKPAKSAKPPKAAENSAGAARSAKQPLRKQTGKSDKSKKARHRSQRQRTR